MSSQGKRSILIGGITGGMGSALAARLIDDGVQVFGFARDKDKLQAFAEKHPKATVFEGNAHDAEAIEGIVKEVGGDNGLDGYAHAIGSIMIKPLNGLSEEDFTKTVNLNLTSAFICLKAAAPLVQKRKGAFVFFSTVAARTGLANHEAIAAAKAGLEGMVRSAAASLVLRGVRVNAIAPGMTETPLAEPLLKSDAARKASEAIHPLGRLGRPEEIVSLAAWLLSEEANWVTGQVMSVDGGLSAIHQRPRT
jgi:NAD(P)-dependent dehydrogenase (short-subunit alcohol dehydrogenase family)